MQRSKSTTGSVVKDKRSRTWQFFWWADGQRHSKTLGRFPTKTAAWNAAQEFRVRLSQPQPTDSTPTVAALVEKYRAERMPKRYSTRRSYEVWIRGYVLPRWGAGLITDAQARPVQMWLESLELSAKSRSEIRGLLTRLWEFAQFCGDVPVQRNPMSLVRCAGASKRTWKPRSLTAEEFQKTLAKLSEPFRTMALFCACFGLRISECLALKWSDVDWLNGKIRVQRGMVRNRVDDVKTTGSERAMFVDAELLEVLKRWKQTTEFSADTDWVFASPSQLGRLPWSYDVTLRAFQRAATAAGIGAVTTHSMRHSFRSWLDAVGTSVAVQQKLMRHADIRTTMNVYGDIVTDAESVAHSKVARLALNGTETGTERLSTD